MSQTKYSTICITLRSPKGKLVEGKIMVRDGFCLSTFSDPTLAKQLYDYDLKAGEKVAFNTELNAYIKLYPNKRMIKILEELKAEIIKAGGKIENEEIKSK